jgi:hypothetical protein
MGGLSMQCRSLAPESDWGAAAVFSDTPIDRAVVVSRSETVSVIGEVLIVTRSRSGSSVTVTVRRIFKEWEPDHWRVPDQIFLRAQEGDLWVEPSHRMRP